MWAEPTRCQSNTIQLVKRHAHVIRIANHKRRNDASRIHAHASACARVFGRGENAICLVALQWKCCVVCRSHFILAALPLTHSSFACPTLPMRQSNSSLIGVCGGTSSCRHIVRVPSATQSRIQHVRDWSKACVRLNSRVTRKRMKSILFSPRNKSKPKHTIIIIIYERDERDAIEMTKEK